MIRRRFGLLLVGFTCAVLGRDSRPTFPQWRGSNLEISGQWREAPIVAVGDLTDIAAYGEQDVGPLPWPMDPTVRRLYWCSANFRLTATVKGELQAPTKKYLWASSQPGCQISHSDRTAGQRVLTRVWFLREEGDFLRPLFDGGTAKFFGLLYRWTDAQADPPQERLGWLLLTPDANSERIEDYARRLPTVADIVVPTSRHFGVYSGDQIPCAARQSRAKTGGL